MKTSYIYENDTLKMTIPNNFKAQNVTDLIKLVDNDSASDHLFLNIGKN